jgi:hypothetical protein
VQPDAHRLVFVAGLHRSGTTLLARLLGAHPAVSRFEGTGVPADEGQHLQSVYPPASTYGGPGRFGFAPESHLTETSPLATPENEARLLEEWSPHWDLACSVLVEKSPPNLLKTRFLQALFPEARFVVVLRHPIPVTLATARWRQTRRLHRLVEHWLACHELFETDRAELARVHVLRYEDLVGEPGATLDAVFRFLELEPVTPGEAIAGGSNEEYYERWRALKRDPRMHAYLTYTELRYERRVRRFGYSLRRP